MATRSTPCRARNPRQAARFHPEKRLASVETYFREHGLRIATAENDSAVAKSPMDAFVHRKSVDERCAFRSRNDLLDEE